MVHDLFLFNISPISSELDKDEKCKTFFVVCGSTFSLNATIIIDAAGLLRNEDHHSKREREHTIITLVGGIFTNSPTCVFLEYCRPTSPTCTKCKKLL